MDALRSRARELLAGGDVKVVIGYAAGSSPRRSRAVFLQRPDQVDRLVLNESCRQNLAVYLRKPEVRALGKPALVALPTTLRTLLQLASEHQLADAAVVALAVAGDGDVRTLESFQAVEEFLATVPHGLTAAQRERTQAVSAMPNAERRQFWEVHLGRCIKCYACRAACPLCYCPRCISDLNQPQWIPVASDALGNLEWNLVRAMHLAGRCVNCGACADACPQGIPIDLLNGVLTQAALEKFGAETGYSRHQSYTLSTFKPDDRADFIR